MSVISRVGRVFSPVVTSLRSKSSIFGGKGSRNPVLPKSSETKGSFSHRPLLSGYSKNSSCLPPIFSRQSRADQSRADNNNSLFNEAFRPSSVEIKSEILAQQPSISSHTQPLIEEISEQQPSSQNTSDSRSIFQNIQSFISTLSDFTSKVKTQFEHISKYSSNKQGFEAKYKVGASTEVETERLIATDHLAGATLTADLSSKAHASAGFSSKFGINTETVHAKAGAAAITKVEGPTATANLDIADVNLTFSTNSFAEAGAEAKTSIHSSSTEEGISFGVGSKSFAGVRAGSANTFGVSSSGVSFTLFGNSSASVGLHSNDQFDFAHSNEEFRLSLKGSFLSSHSPIDLVTGFELKVDQKKFQKEFVDPTIKTLTGKVQELTRLFNSLGSFVKSEPKPWPPSRV